MVGDRNSVEDRVWGDAEIDAVVEPVQGLGEPIMRMRPRKPVALNQNFHYSGPGEYWMP
jgi:hypothetical protein